MLVDEWLVEIPYMKKDYSKWFYGDEKKNDFRLLFEYKKILFKETKLKLDCDKKPTKIYSIKYIPFAGDK